MTSIFPGDNSGATFNNTAPTPSPPIFGGGNDQSMMQDQEPSGSSNNSGILSGSADFILYVIITLFFVLTCTLADRRRRRRLDGLDATTEQLREIRRRQQLHRLEQQNRNIRTSAPNNDPEKQKEEILNALILRTVTISDITVPAALAEEKMNDNDRKNTIHTSSRLSSFLKRSKRGGASASTNSLSNSSTHSSNNKERKRSVLLIRRKTLSGSKLPGRSFNSLHNNTTTDETLSNINVSVRSAQSDIVIGSRRQNNDSSRDIEAGDVINEQQDTSVMMEDTTCTCADEQVGMTRPTTTSTRSVLFLVNEEEQEHSDSSVISSNVASEQVIESPLALSPTPQQTELMGMLLLEEDEDERSSGEDHHHHLHHKAAAIVSSSHGRLADATCSICLLGYDEGDQIAWSRNPKCNHAFHEECIVPWLMTKHDECPNCRNNYFIFEASSKHSTTLDNTPTIISDDDDDDEYTPSSNNLEEEPVMVVPGLTPEERV